MLCLGRFLRRHCSLLALLYFLHNYSRECCWDFCWTISQLPVRFSLIPMFLKSKILYSSRSFFICLGVFEYMFACIYVCMHACENCFLRQGLSLYLELTDWLDCLPVLGWQACTTEPGYLYEYQWSELRLSCLCDKHFVHLCSLALSVI